ncbi:uncharacterized protein BXIN_0861 [Babesia sp. Xinjiang]|uniref:uncharacterized protein n=1 Tax=Babesia sp. Xinjiang TaxID=462227 RepID=UPI000A246261|nr:uncharacterized protein BXIN_0861 [Babesia sp. Xinjiang]ORM41230.1 hypothetical protein BXIN_0861 [Babesia sp. Xinjiang]
MTSDATGEIRKPKRFAFETVDPKLMPAPHINPFLRLLIYIYYILSSGCIYWGWNGFQEILYKAGAFEEYCENVSERTAKVLYGVAYTDCPARAGGINNLYTIAYSTHFIFSFLGGWFLDKFGPRVCFLVGQIFSITAWALVFCFPKNGALLRLAFVLVGLCCEACYIPMLSVSKYFPKGSSTVIAIMGSCRSLSFFVPTLLSWIYHSQGVTEDMLYLIGLSYLLISNVFCLVSGAFIIPKVIPVSPSEQEAVNKRARELEIRDKYESTHAECENRSKYKFIETIKHGIRSPLAMEFFVLGLSVCLFMPSIEFINKSQGDLLVASGDGGDATGIFKYFNVLTFLPGPLLGAMMDKVGPAIVMNFLHACALLYYACTSFDIYAMKIAACCFYLLAGSLCISTVYCYVNTRFPAQYFGILVTVIFGAAGLMALLNIPLYNWGLTLKADVVQQRFRPLSFVFMGYMATACLLSATLIYLSVIRPKRSKGVQLSV